MINVSFICYVCAKKMEVTCVCLCPKKTKNNHKQYYKNKTRTCLVTP